MAVVQWASRPPLVHRRGRWCSGHSGRRACSSPSQYRRLLRSRWAHEGQRKGPWGAICIGRFYAEWVRGVSCRLSVPPVPGTAPRDPLSSGTGADRRRRWVLHGFSSSAKRWASSM